VKSFVTSFAGMFGHDEHGELRIDGIDIPIIQRDYAQGRQGQAVERIRTGFLNAIHHALTNNEHLHLDFVYGDVRDGVLRPLDGQQRLTTLFLLHWYLAYRSGHLDEDAAWKRFGYAVRPTARLFCERLVEYRPPCDLERISTWLQDQPQHLATWSHDPTIEAMLVMLDAIHERFADDDCAATWKRLTDPADPAITFHLLPMKEPGSGEELYIKMNSRGKPLTPFENFKARFEKTVEAAYPERAEELALKIDGAWSDLLWPYRGDDDIIDDELLRYLHFVTEICEWRTGRSPEPPVEDLANFVFGPDRADAREQLDFLFEAFDAWTEQDVRAFFEGVFSKDRAPGRVVLFALPEGAGVDLFELCCRTYGATSGKKRLFPLALSLLLAGTLMHRINSTPGFSRRLRTLRNLVEASSNEVRADRMQRLLEDVHHLIVEGDLASVSSFNTAQREEEEAKAALLTESPALENVVTHLEDHPLLRGNLSSFELDPSTLERRATLFERIFRREHWPALTGALLTCGTYWRELGWKTFRFGSGRTALPWTEVLARLGRAQQEPTRAALAQLFDRLEGAADISSALNEMTSTWLAEREAERHFDWRYYFVRYPAMRSGRSGLYVSEEDHLGYRIVMLHKTRLNSNYRDPYLLAVHRESGVEEAIEEAWFTGYANRERWMQLARSGTALRCVDEGFLLRAPPPTEVEARKEFEEACGDHGIGDDLLVGVDQDEVDGRPLDRADRVQKAVMVVRDLVERGL